MYIKWNALSHYHDNELALDRPILVQLHRIINTSKYWESDKRIIHVCDCCLVSKSLSLKTNFWGGQKKQLMGTLVGSITTANQGQKCNPRSNVSLNRMYRSIPLCIKRAESLQKRAPLKNRNASLSHQPMDEVNNYWTSGQASPFPATVFLLRRRLWPEFHVDIFPIWHQGVARSWPQTPGKCGNPWTKTRERVGNWPRGRYEKRANPL